ncbi:MAG: methylmalonyl-CoA carboxyltransferase, partial [Bacillota bacterium]|nr:methylmalonyl-CoA carboxyltransferase [Bacillota bacterium]
PAPEEKRKEKIAEYEEKFNNPYCAAERGYVEDIIEPATARQKILEAFEMLRTKKQELPEKRHGNIPL